MDQTGVTAKTGTTGVNNMADAAVMPMDTGMQTITIDRHQPANRSAMSSVEYDDIGEEYLAEAVVRLIRSNPAVQRAVLNLVMSCSNIKKEY